RLYRGRTGVGWLALTTGVPVIPVGLIDTDKLQPPGKNIILPRKFEVHVGPPIHVEHHGPKHVLQLRRQTTDTIMDKIPALTGQKPQIFPQTRALTVSKTPTVGLFMWVRPIISVPVSVHIS